MNWVNIGRVTEDIGQFKRDMLTEYRTCQTVFTSQGHKCHNKSMDLDHCLIRRNKRFEKWINSMPWNWMASCDICNRYTHATDTRINRQAWMAHVVKKYGRERIEADMLTAPDKMQAHNSDWNEVMGWLSKVPNGDFETEDK